MSNPLQLPQRGREECKIKNAKFKMIAAGGPGIVVEHHEAWRTVVVAGFGA